MAFNSNQSRPDMSNRGGIPEDKKAQGYINISLPTANGKEWKLVGIPLKISAAREKELADWFEANGEQAEEIFKANVLVRYNSATPAAGNGFAALVK